MGTQERLQSGWTRGVLLRSMGKEQLSCGVVNRLADARSDRVEGGVNVYLGWSYAAFDSCCRY